MKKRPFLDVLENASLIGLGVGSVASLVFQQALYATAPLSLLVALGLINRRQLEKRIEQDSQNALNQVDRRLNQKLTQITAQVEQMPTVETIQRIKRGVLIKNRELAGHFYSEITALQKKLEKRLTPLENHNLRAMEQELQSLGEQYRQLVEGLGLLNAEIAQLQKRNDRPIEQPDPLPIPSEEKLLRVASLQADLTDLRGDLDSLTYYVKANTTNLEQRVNRLDYHLSKLPLSSADSGVSQQELAELVKAIGDLASRQEFAQVADKVEILQRDQDALRDTLQAIEAAAMNLRRSFKQKPQTEGEHSEQEAALGSELAGAIAQQTGEPLLTPANLYPELQTAIKGYLKNLRSQIRTVRQTTEQLAQQQQQLQDRIHRVPQSLDAVALQQQIKELARRIPSAESVFDSFESRVQSVLKQKLEAINEQLQALPATPRHQLLFDLSDEPSTAGGLVPVGNRALLEEALNRTQERLILIWPWFKDGELDDALLQKLESFLSQKRQLDLGWCQIADAPEADTATSPEYGHQERVLSKIRRGWSNQTEQTALQQTLQKLLQLKRAYPEYFQFKILGARENFLVCDRAFAVLGISEPLKTTAAFTELQVKLRTTDPEMIQRLIDRFDNPTLDPDDLTAYWNRAVTRYQLGDKIGAVEDYNHILSRQPDNAVALNARGVALFDLGDRESALLDFSQSIQANPHQSDAHLNRGFMRSDQGDLWGAITDYTAAIQVAPEGALAYFYRGMAWQKREQHREALNDFSDAVRLAPRAAVVCYYRGLARQRLGQLEEAIDDLQKAAEYFTARGSKTNAEKALKHLAKLQQEIQQREQSLSLPHSLAETEDGELTLPLIDMSGGSLPRKEEPMQEERSENDYALHTNSLVSPVLQMHDRNPTAPLVEAEVFSSGDGEPGNGPSPHSNSQDN